MPLLGDALSKYAPGIAIYNGQLVLAWNEPTGNTLQFTSYNLQSGSFGGLQQVPNLNLQFSPALCTWNGVVYFSLQDGLSGSTSLLWGLTDLSSFVSWIQYAGDTDVRGPSYYSTNALNGPVLSSSGKTGSLLALFVDKDNNDIQMAQLPKMALSVKYNNLDVQNGQNLWDQPVALSMQSSNAPTLAVTQKADGSELWMLMWLGQENEAGVIWTSQSTDFGSNWTEPIQFPYPSLADMPPSLATLNGIVYAFWISGDSGNQQAVMMSTYNANQGNPSWTEEVPVQGIGPNSTIAATAGAAGVFLGFAQGAGTVSNPQAGKVGFVNVPIIQSGS